MDDETTTGTMPSGGGGRIRIPEHVVFRSFAAQTVVLNLQTGKYHGLNPTAGRMLELLQADGDLSEAVERLTEEYARPRDEIASDLSGLCRDLAARGLIEFEDAPGAR